MVKKSIKLVDAIKGYLLSRRSKCNDRTIEWYRQKLALFCSTLQEEYEITNLKDVTVTQLRLFVEHIKETKADANNPHKPTRENVCVSDLTVKGYVQVMKGFFTWCVREGLIKDNPAANLDNPKVGHYVIKTFSQEQIRTMLSLCETSTMVGFRDYVIILFLLDTGVRVSEMCGLTLNDVHLALLDQAFIKVMGKGRKEREIGLSSELAQLLWKYINVHRLPRKEDSGVLFINRFGEQLTVNGVEQMLQEIAKKAGFVGIRVSPHTFRHTFAVMFLENGGDIYKLSLLLGHSSVVVTENYLKDFYSRNARKGQSQYSPVARMDIGRMKKGFQKSAKDVLGE